MTPGARHWIAAAALSAAGHVAIVAWAGTMPEQPSVEAGAGAESAVWGMEFESIAEEAMPVETQASAGETDAKQEVDDAEEAQDAPVEEVETAIEPERPAEPEPDEVETAEAPTATETAETAATTEAVETPDVSDAVEAFATTETAVTTDAAESADAVEATEAAPVEHSEEPVEEIETAALTDVRAIQEVTTEDVTIPLPRPRPADVPWKKDPPKKTRQAAPRKETPAPARPQQQAAVPAGEQTGSTGQPRREAGRAETTNYSGRIVAHLQRYKRYPREAARQRLGGTATLSFTVAANGQVQGAQLSGPTGHQPLDTEALAMVQRATPFPPIPPSIGRSSMTFTVPVRFAPR